MRQGQLFMPLRIRSKVYKLFRIPKILIIVITVICLGLWVAKIYNTHRPYVERQTRFIMDTYVTISAIGPRQAAYAAVNSAMERIKEIDLKFNSLNPKSPIYLFNHQGLAISDPEILELIRLALEVSRKSEGAFDITVASLLELWGFTGKSYRIPQEQEIKNCLEKVGYRHLSINSGKLIKDNEGAEIDLGGIAKGYALIEAVKVLKARGIVSALIDAGGDVYALGKKAGGLWKIGIRSPREEGLIGYVEVENLSVMGSGDYERFFIKDGKRYHHIFDPKTGYPTESVTGVTLIYPNPVLAQAWAKIPFVMGAKKGLEILGMIPDMEAIIVDGSGEVLYSSGLKHILKAMPATK